MATPDDQAALDAQIASLAAERARIDAQLRALRSQREKNYGTAQEQKARARREACISVFARYRRDGDTLAQIARDLGKGYTTVRTMYNEGESILLRSTEEADSDLRALAEHIKEQDRLLARQEAERERSSDLERGRALADEDNLDFLRHRPIVNHFLIRNGLHTVGQLRRFAPPSDDRRRFEWLCWTMRQVGVEPNW